MFQGQGGPQDRSQLLGVTSQYHLTSSRVVGVQEVGQGYDGLWLHGMTRLINEDMGEVVIGEVLGGGQPA